MLTEQLVLDVCARCDQIVISAHFIFPLSSGPPTLYSNTLRLNSERSIKLQDCSVVVVLQVFLVVREKYVYEVLFCCILVLHGFFGIRKN